MCSDIYSKNRKYLILGILGIAKCLAKFEKIKAFQTCNRATSLRDVNTNRPRLKTCALMTCWHAIDRLHDAT